MIKQYQNVGKPIHDKKQNSIQLENDVISIKEMVVDLPIFEQILFIQKFNCEKSGVIKLPVNIDENILKTIAEEKLFRNMISKKVQEDKQ